VCVAHCTQGVLRMVDSKALIDLRNLNQCDMDGECVEVCPTDVVSLVIQPGEPADSADPADAIHLAAAMAEKSPVPANGKANGTESPGVSTVSLPVDPADRV
jgi:ferredoxin